MNLNPPDSVRGYLYGIAIAFAALCVYLGWLEPQASPLILAIVMALLNVPRKPRDRRLDREPADPVADLGD